MQSLLQSLLQRVLHPRRLRLDHKEEKEMQTLQAFERLGQCEEYFEFFGIPYDEKVMRAKRLHILKYFGDTIRKLEWVDASESQKLLLYRNALLAIYQTFLHNAPSAQEVWGESKCAACHSIGECSTC
ncbi:Nitrogenase-stabilizing/protective protein nifW [Wolinella succinogenes]|nr:Nitrogenase-stabilizing/protective protein nifW [Wolinella succinogenes]HCZ19710.1 nitrogen fixation protein NifW [Helicobacter sp.]